MVKDREFYSLLAKEKAEIVSTTIDTVTYVLQSKHGFTPEDILAFYNNMTSVSEMISEGRLNIHDIRKANLEELNVITKHDT